jgi:hypothetical protein
MPTVLPKSCVFEPWSPNQAGDAEEGKKLLEEPESALHVLSLHL